MSSMNDLIFKEISDKPLRVYFKEFQSPKILQYMHVLYQLSIDICELNLILIKFKFDCKRLNYTNTYMFPQQQNKLSQGNDAIFDQKPIGQGQKMPDISEYPPDFNANDINLQFKSEPLPLQKRVHSKVWKIRKQAFQQLFNQVSENASVYQEYLKDTVKFITDSTPICQQKALKILLKYVQSPSATIDDPKPVLKALIQKCLVVQKGQTQNLSVQIMFWFMDNYQQLLVSQVNQNILNKNPKISASSIYFLQKLLNNYGAKKLKQFQQFGKNFTLLSSSVRPRAKQQSINLFKQMYKWMGDLALGFNMHPQVKEQVVKFAKTHVKQPMTIKRGLNEDQKKGKKPITQNMEDQNDDEPQDVLTNYDSRWVDKVLQQPKWKDKKGHLDEFIKKTQAKNIVPRQNTHYITLIKRLIVENNINLLQCGFKVVKNLCKGLKRNFTQPCKVILQLIFSKLRDTKTVIVEEAQQTLESMMNCLTLDDMIEDIKKGLSDKAPNMRLQTLIFVEKMAIKKNKKMMGAFKILTIQIVDLNQDGSSQVRDKALDVLCKLKSGYGLSFFGDKLKKLQGKKLENIQNYIDPNATPAEEQPAEKEEPNKFSKTLIYQNGPQSQKSVPNSQKNSMINEQPPKTSNINSQFQSNSQNVRILLYQAILQKQPQVINQQLIQAFRNKVPMFKQSNPFILKIILNCVKKSIHSTVGLEHMELLMHHDWKKCKSLLVQFIQNNKLSLPALQYVKNMGVLSQTQTQLNKKFLSTSQKSVDPQTNSQINSLHSSATNSNTGTHTNQSLNSLKYFYSCLHNLIPKMSNPDPVVRLQAAQSAIQILQTIQNGALNQTSTQPSPAISQAVSQYFNVLKFRIQDSNEQIANSYINLVTQMLAKGFITKYRTPGRLLVSMLIQKINNPRLTNLQYFIQQMVTTHPVLLWQYMATQICKQAMCNSVLSIIRKNNESFFKNADQKSYMLPLLTCISKDIQPMKCSQLLDQIVQINGQQYLQKLIRQTKISNFNIDTYLKKWNISSNPQNSTTQKSKLNQNLSIPYPSSKIQRLNNQTQNAWPLTCSPTHILKMINNMMSMGQPFQTLALPTLLTDHQLSIISNLSTNLIQDYSDILCKWIYWRVHLEYQPKNFQHIFALITRMINIGFQLHESQIITLLGALISCLSLYKSLYLKHIIRINNILNQHPLYKQKSFRFWINSFNDPTAPVDEILNLIVNSCPQMIPSQMVTLARYPSVVRNKQFNQYLKSNYTQKLLTVYGFKLSDISKTVHKQLLSQSLVSDKNIYRVTQIEQKYFMQLFQRSSSNELIDKVMEQTREIPNQYMMQTHLKIMHAIIVPYLHRQLSFINVYNYFKYLQKIIVSINISTSSFLLQLVCTLSYFLIDLDQVKLQNNTQMLKTINKLLLILLQVTEPAYILNVLFIMIKQQLRTNGNVKLSLLLPKCIGKVIRNPVFTSQYMRTMGTNGGPAAGAVATGGDIKHNQCITLIIQQLLEIISIYNIGDDTPMMKTIKHLLTQVINMFPGADAVAAGMISGHVDGENTEQRMGAEGTANINERGRTFIRELLEEKNKRENKNNTSIMSALSTENTYVQSKDAKSTAIMMKALRPPNVSAVKDNKDMGQIGMYKSADKRDL